MAHEWELIRIPKVDEILEQATHKRQDVYVCMKCSQVVLAGFGQELVVPERVEDCDLRIVKEVMIS